MKHIAELNEAVNPEAVIAIETANAEFGFKFDINKRTTNYYSYTAPSNIPIWKDVVYKLYKVQGTTWKIAMEPVIDKNVKEATRRVDLMWFDIKK
jgi:hypothetical protein